MSVSLLRKGWLALALSAVLLPTSALAQSREVVAKEVSVGRSEATLRLEFDDSGDLEIRFEDGRVWVDGDAVGSYEAGGALEREWRTLLGEAIALEDGALADMLADWTVPADLAADVADVAREIDRALEDALDDIELRVRADDGTVSVSIGDGSSLISTLLSSIGRLGALEEAFEGLDSEVRLHLDEDVTVRSGNVVEGNLVVIGGTARIEGEVHGDVVVVGGELDLREGGRVDGEIRIADTRVVRNEGTVRDGIVDLLEAERASRSELRTRLRDEVEREVRSDLRRELREISRGEDSFSIMSPFRPVVRAVGGVAESLVTILILALLGAGVLAFGGERVDVIADTARSNPGRAAAVGIAGSILLIPVWAFGAVALAVSIIFIPVAIVWVPLFPLAAALAGLVGYLAVARNTGEWLADREYPWTGWIRKSNGWIAMVGGLVALMAAFIAAHVLSIAPFLGFFTGLLAFVGTVITFVAIQIGFGAVILTRAGRRREWSAYDPDAAWEEAMNIEVDIDDEPSGGAAGA